MPDSRIHPAAYWAATGSVFFSALFIAVVVQRLSVWGYFLARRLQWPHSLVIISRGGRTAVLEVTHYGEPATWEMRMRIVRTLDESVNPDPLSRLCYLRRDGKSHTSLLLKNGESANVVLAHIEYSEWGHGSWVAVHDAEGSHIGTRVPDAGVIIEAEFKAVPAMDGIANRCFRLARKTHNKDDCLDLSDESCD